MVHIMVVLKDSIRAAVKAASMVAMTGLIMVGKLDVTTVVLKAEMKVSAVAE